MKSERGRRAERHPPGWTPATSGWSRSLRCGWLSLCVVSITAGASAQTLPAELANGQRLFLRYCAECHGETGDGYGKFSYTTAQRPRSLQAARYKIASTASGIPTDDDLRRAIREGLPGSGMPEHALPDADVDQIARYVRWLGTSALTHDLAARVRAGELTEEQSRSIFERRTNPGPPIEVPPEPEFGPERRADAIELYREACAPCHGLNGQTTRDHRMVDFEGNHSLPTSLVAGVFKGGNDPRQVFIRLAAGMAGTGMPAYREVYSDQQIWDLTHLVQEIVEQGGLGLEDLEEIPPAPTPEIAIAREENRPIPWIGVALGIFAVLFLGSLFALGIGGLVR